MYFIQGTLNQLKNTAFKIITQRMFSNTTRLSFSLLGKRRFWSSSHPQLFLKIIIIFKDNYWKKGGSQFGKQFKYKYLVLIL